MLDRLNKYKGLLFAISAIIFAASTLVSNCSRKAERARLNDISEQILDTLHRTRDELNREIVTTRAIVGAKYDLDIFANATDSSLRELARLVKRNTQSATILNSETIIREVAPVISVDSNFSYTYENYYPVYTADFDSEFLKGRIVASRDSIYPDIKVVDKLKLSHDWKRKSIFKPRELTVQAKNENPYTTITDLESFSVKVKPRRFGVGFHVGAGLDVQRFKFSPQIGVSLQYRLISF